MNAEALSDKELDAVRGWTGLATPEWVTRAIATIDTLEAKLDMALDVVDVASRLRVRPIFHDCMGPMCLLCGYLPKALDAYQEWCDEH